MEKVHLTSSFVDAALPPERGERWIADTEIQGFGLRLWATNSGEGKAFAIRTFTTDGRIVRRTFDIRKSSEYRCELIFDLESRGLGSYLVSARRWACSEICRLKGLFPRLDRSEAVRVRKAEQTLQSSVQKATENLLDDMRRRKLSDPYIDRLDKLFFIHLPKAIRSAPMAEVSPSQIATALSKANLAPTALRVLRNFVIRVFETAVPAKSSLLYFSRELDDLLHGARSHCYNGLFNQLEDFAEENYETLFQRLEAEKTYWQQGMCVRLFFEFWTPFHRLLGARWDGIVHGRWYPYPPSERRLNFRYGGLIDNRVAGLLDRVRRLGTEEFGASSYWFPSRFGRKFGHIRTVDTIWRDALYDIGARYFPLRKAALSYRYSEFYRRRTLKRVFHAVESRRVLPDVTYRESAPPADADLRF